MPEVSDGFEAEKVPGMKRSIYMLLGWLAWKFGKRAAQRRFRIAGR